MNSLFQTLRILAVIGSLCVCTRTTLAVYNVPDPSAPLGDPTVFRVVDSSYQPAGYLMPAPVTIEPVPAPEPAAQYDPVVLPPLLTVPGERCAVPAAHSWLTESTIYTRLDYARWNEMLGGNEFVDERGSLWTLGYEHRFDRQRIRAEMFTSRMTFSDTWENEFGQTESVDAPRNYLGVRGEYELLFEPENTPRATFFLGFGTRFWIRDIPDEVTSIGRPLMGYQETWWTFYPYIGVERRRKLGSGWELYGMGRAGVTVITWEKVSYFDVVLYPQPGLNLQLECGLRGEHLFTSAFFEILSWGESDEVRGILQPQSTLATLGLRTGCSF